MSRHHEGHGPYLHIPRDEVQTEAHGRGFRVRTRAGFECVTLSARDGEAMALAAEGATAEHPHSWDELEVTAYGRPPKGFTLIWSNSADRQRRRFEGEPHPVLALILRHSAGALFTVHIDLAHDVWEGEVMWESEGREHKATVGRIEFVDLTECVAELLGAVPATPEDDPDRYNDEERTP